MNEESHRPNNFYFANECSSDDLFVCGKCQCQFKDIKVFMDHKNNFCMTNNIHGQMKLPSMNSRDHNFHTNNFYTEDVSNGYIGGYDASNSINYLYNDGNTPKNNINGSYVSYIGESKYQQMEFSNELGDCINKGSYFNELALPQHKTGIFDENSTNDINYQIYPLSGQVFNVQSEGFIDQCNGDIMKASISNVDFVYPTIIAQNGNYLNSIDMDVNNETNNSCLYNYDSDKIIMSSTKNNIEIVNIDTNNYSNSFNNVNSNHTQGIYTVPSFKDELLGESVAIVNSTGIENVPISSDKVSKCKNYNINTSEISCEPVVVEHQSNENKITKKYECDYCLKVFFRYSNLEQHLRLHTGEKPFQCPICGRKFNQKSNAKKHIKSHKVWINNDDSSLPKFHTFGVQLKDKRHIIVRPSKSLSPIISRKQFHLLTNIKNKSVFGVSADNQNPVILVNNSFECSFCKQKFQSYQNLRTHIVTHKDLQVYLCVFADCKQTFEDLEPFLHHLEAHKKEENIKFNCQFCGTLFMTLYELMCHYKIHKDNRIHMNFKCQKCHKQIDDNQLKVTENVNEYFCSHCNKTFQSQKNFKSHVNSFLVKQHFNCPICSKEFNAEIYLSRHLRIFHKSSMILFKCKQCDKIFRTMSSLKYHRLSQHKILPHPDCKVSHCDHKRHCSANSMCQCSMNTNKQLKKRKGNAINTPCTSVPETQTELPTKHNFEEDGMVCFYCEKLYRRRLPFESHVLMCKQKEIEKERRESYRNQRFLASKETNSVEAFASDCDKSSRRSKFTKTWTVKSSRKKMKPDLTTTEPFSSAVKQTLPSIAILNKSYDLPLESINNLNPYGSESFSFLKSLEFNS